MTASPSDPEEILNGCYATLKNKTDKSNYWWGRQYYQLADLNEIIDHRMDYNMAAEKGFSPSNYHLTSADIKTNLVDLVLTQKRVEFSFEGFRIYDLLRNKKDVIRNYWGFHTNYDNGKNTDQLPGLNAPGVYTKYDYGWLLCPIPQQEISNNSICTQNEAYI